MSEKTSSFKSKEEWDKTKYVREKTPEYVNNYLHHEGLLCLTDHQWYFLNPTEEGANDLPDLNTLNLNADLRLFWVRDPLALDWDTNSIIIVAEKQLVDPPPSQLNYSMIFLDILQLFRDKRELWIYWNGIPAEDLIEVGAEEEVLSDEEREVVFNASSLSDELPPPAASAMAGRVKVNYLKEEEEPEEAPVENLDRAAGLFEIHLTEEDAPLLERCHIFLFIKDKLFYLSHLNAILDRGEDNIPQDYFPKH